MKAKRRLFTEITSTFFYPTSMFFGNPIHYGPVKSSIWFISREVMQSIECNDVNWNAQKIHHVNMGIFPDGFCLFHVTNLLHLPSNNQLVIVKFSEPWSSGRKGRRTFCKKVALWLSFGINSQDVNDCI